LIHANILEKTQKTESKQKEDQKINWEDALLMRKK